MLVKSAAFAVFALCSFIYQVKADDEKCPTNLPLEIDGQCYRLQTKEWLPWKDARDNCPKMESAAVLTSAPLRSEAVMDEIEKRVKAIVESKIKKALFWIGFYTDDTTYGKGARDRNWKWNIDKSVIVQKDYILWDQAGGTDNKGFTCAALNASNYFLVQAVDCGGPRVPVICQMKDGKACKDDALPYLTYDGYCLAAVNAALEYNKIVGGCSPNAPTSYREDIREAVILAAKNSFIGGGIYMNIRKMGGKFIEMSDGTEVDDDLWEDGEPRDEYECAGLSIQKDYSLKLKTMNCGIFASSMCAIQASPDQD